MKILRPFRFILLAVSGLGISLVFSPVVQALPVESVPRSLSHPRSPQHRSTNRISPANSNFWMAYKQDNLKQGAKWVKQMNCEKPEVRKIHLVSGTRHYLLTPLMIASYEGRLSWVKLLLSAGAKVGAVDETEESSVMRWAARGGHAEVVKALLKAGGDANSLSGNSQSQGTVLMSAASYNKVEVVRLLLASGAKVNFVTRDGFTALLIATRRNSTQSIKALLEAKADVNVKQHTKESNGYTPLHLAVQYCDLATCHLLLKAKVNPNARAQNGWTPLHLAAALGKKDVAQTLLQAGAIYDLKDREGRTPNDLAIAHGHSPLERPASSH